jgi:hypothetical protein
MPWYRVILGVGMNALGIAIAVAIAALVLTAKKPPNAQKVRVPVEKAGRSSESNKSNR